MCFIVVFVVVVATVNDVFVFVVVVLVYLTPEASSVPAVVHGLHRCVSNWSEQV